MTTMTEQEAICVLREALDDIAWKRTPNERKSAEWVDRHEQRALAALAATASIQPVAAADPFAWAVCDGIPRKPVLTVYSASEAAGYRSENVVPLYTAAPVQAATDEVRDKALEEAAVECEREQWYPGGRQPAQAHNNVWDAAKAIRALKRTPADDSQKGGDDE